MKKLLKAAAATVAALSLAACTSTGSAALLQNLQNCRLVYQGSLGGGQVGGSAAATLVCDPPPATDIDQTPTVTPPRQPTDDQE